MTDRDIEVLIKLVEDKMKQGETKEDAIKNFMILGTMTKKGEFTEPYAISNKIITPM